MLFNPSQQGNPAASFPAALQDILITLAFPPEMLFKGIPLVKSVPSGKRP